MKNTKLVQREIEYMQNIQHQLCSMMTCCNVWLTSPQQILNYTLDIALQKKTSKMKRSTNSSPIRKQN